MKGILNIVIIIFIIIFIINLLFKKKIENFESVQNRIGNTLCSYFYDYALSICNKEDFNCIIPDYEIIKFLPSYIPFDSNIYDKFQENNITKDLIISNCDVCLWHCNEVWIYNFWVILKPIINKLLNNAIEKSNLKNKIDYPIIHLRCADVPFIKQSQYYLQKYSFFKDALNKIIVKDNTIIIMYYFNHKADDNNITTCNKYLNNLVDYLSNLGYTCKLQSKSNFEDFADLFNAPYVISTGGSFSFISGFCGNGTLISTEHCEENTNCCNDCGDTFLKNYNIYHKLIASYYDIDDVEKYRH